MTEREALYHQALEQIAKARGRKAADPKWLKEVAKSALAGKLVKP